MSKCFDLIVVGTGPCGSAIATKCSSEGWDVAIIDSRGYGGTCPLRGCIPKKVLTNITEINEQNDRMQGSGIEINSKINWSELIDYKRKFTESVPAAMESNLKEAGITTFHGEAVFTSEDEILVGKETITGKKIVIATGANPVKLPIKGEEYLTNSDEFLELNTLPRRVIFVGGGYVSFEFAQIAARSGSEVHILQRGDRALKSFDADFVNMLIKKSTDIGIHVHLNTSVEGIEKSDQLFTVIAEKNGDKVSFKGDMVVHGAGRAPEVGVLHPDNGNIKYHTKGIIVNNFLQSVSNPKVYAAGDVADTKGAPLTPVAGIEAEVVSENLLHGNDQKADYTGTPSVTFTSPKLAKVGISAEEGKKLGANVIYTDASEFFTYKHMKQDYAAVKVITDKNNEYILGAHLISDEADELVNYFAMAIQLNIKINDLKKVTYAFPTAVSDIPSFI